MSIFQYIRGLTVGVISGRLERRVAKRLGRILNPETLESRWVLTGNMAAAFNGVTHVLTFTGDIQNNEIAFSVNGSGDAIATGVNGTTINGAAFLNISTFTGESLSAVVINGGDGADIITLDTVVNPITFPVAVTVNGGNGNDTFSVGTTGGQSINFNSLTILGGAGNDAVTFRCNLGLSSGPAQIDGGVGNDTYAFDTDSSLGSVGISDSGAGVDTLNFSLTTTRAVIANLSSAAAQVVNAGLTLTLSAGNTLENVIGGALGDTLTGNSLANRLTGNKGNDTLTGSSGNDTYVFDTDFALGSDTINESGGGVDTLDFSATTTRAVTVNLSNAAAQVVNAGLTLTLSAGNTLENVVGGALGDTLTGNGRANRLTGNNGNDTLTGSSGNDRYVFDTDVALGSDTINEAGGGTDTLDFSATTTRAVSVNLSNAAAQVVNVGLTLTLSAGNTLEDVIGGALGDSLTGNDLANHLTGNNGNDTLNGAAGSDILSGGLGNNTLNGGAGGDDYDIAFRTAAEVDTLSDGLDSDYDQLNFGFFSTDVILNLSAAPGLQIVSGAFGLNLNGVQFSRLVTGSGNDTLTGRATLATVFAANAGNDTLIGGTANDYFYGYDGNDTMTGGAGNDTYVFDTDVAVGNDTINESGGGVDTLDFGATTTRAVVVNLANAAAQIVNVGLTLTLSANNTIENVVGGSLGDTLTGNTLANSLTGGAGDDTLSGGSGRDLLIGGAGLDNLQGGAGEDLLVAGRTTFSADVFALLDLRAEWVRTDISFDARVAHLMGTVPGGLNGATVLSSSTVKEDADQDTLVGGSNRDWYLRNGLGAVVAQRDVVTDADLDSLFTEISAWL